MKFATSVLIVVGSMSLVASQVQPAPTHRRSLGDGVYTSAQMKRGESLYNQYCTSCHMLDTTWQSHQPARPAGQRTVHWSAQRLPAPTWCPVCVELDWAHAERLVFPNPCVDAAERARFS